MEKDTEKDTEQSKSSGASELVVYTKYIRK